MAFKSLSDVGHVKASRSKWRACIQILGERYHGPTRGSRVDAENDLPNMRAWPKIVQRDDVRRQRTPTMARRRVTFRELQEEDEKIRATGPVPLCCTA